MKSITLSVLDLAPLLEGETPQQSLKHVGELAQHTENLDYKRYWLAEHHDMPGILSSAPEVLITHVAQLTKKIRVGSGGIMLPNHAALHIAEVFRTLEALYPGRIDLGLGRAPGSGQKTARALRAQRGLDADAFPQDLRDLRAWLKDLETHPSFPGVRAVPTQVSSPELWMLGSSDFGAQLAAYEGMPYAFAQHFSSIPALAVLELYHESFRPSDLWREPHAMMAVHIVCARTDEEARELALSSDLSFSHFVRTGQSMPLPSVESAKAYPYNEEDWKAVRATAMPKFVGSPYTIRRQLERYLSSGLVQELMILSTVYDQVARRAGYTLLAEALR